MKTAGACRTSPVLIMCRGSAAELTSSVKSLEMSGKALEKRKFV